MWKWLKSIPNQVFIGLIVLAVSGMVLWVFNYVSERVTDTPVTASISANDAQTSIRPFFDIQIRPALGRYCSEPAWIQWLGNWVWGKMCQRIEFDPHMLADMQTRRVPFRESAEPIQLMRIFVQWHKGCLDIEQTGDTYRIFEPVQSAVLREGTTLVCP